MHTMKTKVRALDCLFARIMTKLLFAAGSGLIGAGRAADSRLGCLGAQIYAPLRDQPVDTGRPSCGAASEPPRSPTNRRSGGGLLPAGGGRHLPTDLLVRQVTWSVIM